MPYKHLILIRQAGLRHISEAEVLDVLGDEEMRLPRESPLLDMRPFEADVEGGVWDASERYIIEEAQRIRSLADEEEEARLLYFGLAEIPHAVALGAYLGDERHVEVYDYQRDRSTWNWLSEEENLKATPSKLSDVVPKSGSVVVRIPITAAIADRDVEDVVGTDHVADVTVQVEDTTPEVATTVQSQADVQEIRRAFRSMLSSLAEKRPGAEMIHLFVAAPTPVCFAIGQELHLRNSVPVQTYRFRRRAEQPSYQSAIELTAEEAEAGERELTVEEVDEADRVRSKVWPEALEEVQQYARMKERSKSGGSETWYQALAIRDNFGDSAPFPALPAFWEVVDYEDDVDPEPLSGTEYGHDESSGAWRLSDPLLLSLSQATENNVELRRLIHLFLFHEYVHRHHSLTKYTAEGVGRFANCLERLDYMADLYALLHQLDWAFVYDQNEVEGREKEYLEEQLDLLLRSAWAFVPGETVDRWQVRRVRRLLNWYWRFTQVQHSDDLETALAVLGKPPAVELVGQELRSARGRTFMMMTNLDPTVELSLGLVTEDERLLRITDQVNYNLRELMEAFRYRRHREIKIFFAGVFEEARQMGGALPAL